MKDYFLKVGFSRVKADITEPLPLGGYGNTLKRLSQRLIDEISATCIAITDKDDNTVLLITHDLLNNQLTKFEKIRETVSKATGVSKDRIFITATHTHSAPDPYTSTDSIIRFYDMLAQKEAEAAKQALDDRAPSYIMYGETESSPLNFIRHCYTEDGGIVADNHIDRKSPDSPVVKYCTPNDRSMQILKFVRDGKKDIIYVNWRSHALITGGGKKYDMSADFPFTLRKFVEQDTGCLCAYFQGCAGNVDPHSHIKKDDVTKDYEEFGRILADNVISALPSLKAGKEGCIKCINKTVHYKMNHADEDKLEDAKKVYDFWESTNDRKLATEYAKKFGFYSPYHAGAIIKRVDLPEYSDAELAVMSIGDISFAYLPGEPFVDTGLYIRNHSPFDKTLVMGYTGPRIGYIPTKDAFGYGCYEVECTRVAEGTAEEFAEISVKMLNDIY